jgi:hypothetical protein
MTHTSFGSPSTYIQKDVSHKKGVDPVQCKIKMSARASGDCASFKLLSFTLNCIPPFLIILHAELSGVTRNLALWEKKE